MSNENIPSINMVSSDNETPFSYEKLNALVMTHLEKYGIDTSELIPVENIIYDPLEIILEQVLKNKISPENINIIEIADFYIAILYALKKFDIRESARVIYRASRLLKIKAEELKLENERTEYEFSLIDSLLEDAEFMGDLTSKFQSEIPGHYKTDEIVLSVCWQASRERYLQMLEDLEPAQGKMDFFDRPSLMTTEQIIEIAHEEDIIALKDKLLVILKALFEQNGSVPFTMLTENIKHAKSMVFITLLHLATDKKVWLAQDETYDTELMIFPPNQISLGSDL